MPRRNLIRQLIDLKPSATAFIAVLVLASLATAGSLTPSASPASTMHSLSEVYASIASSAFDSSAITANQNGSLIAQLKYMNNQLAWASSSTDIWNLNSGNVGIGTTTPTTKLDIVGNASVSGSFEAGTLLGDGQSLTLARLGNSTFKSMQDLQTFFHSSGLATGGAISDIGGGNVSVTAGTGAIRSSNVSVVVNNKRKDGTLYRASLRVSPVLNAMGQVKLFIATQSVLP